MLIIVDENPLLPEPIEIARREQQVYSMVSVDSKTISDPRAITTFTETDGKFHKAIKYMESSANRFAYSWLCESQRAHS